MNDVQEKRLEPKDRGWTMAVIAIVLASVILVLFLIALGYYFVLNPKLAHPAEDTSRFLPQNTRIYASVNLRPGVRQIRHAIKILSAFKATGDDIKEGEDVFPEQVEDRFDDFEDETGISIEQELFTWIGPEIAIGLVDSGEDLSLDSIEAVAFVGTTNVILSLLFGRVAIVQADDKEAGV